MSVLIYIYHVYIYFYYVLYLTFLFYLGKLCFFMFFLHDFCISCILLLIDISMLCIVSILPYKCCVVLYNMNVLCSV